MSGYANPRTDAVPEGIKRCSRCEIDYEPTTDNFPRGTGADGLDAWCKTCVSLRGKRLRQIKAAETRASDMLALEVGRASWDETGWRLDRLGINWTDDLTAKVTPLVVAYTTTQSDDDLRAIGRALIEAGAKLRRSAPAAATTTAATEDDEPEDGDLDLDPETANHVGPTIPPDEALPLVLGLAYADARLGVPLRDGFGESVAALVAESRQAHDDLREAYRAAKATGTRELPVDGIRAVTDRAQPVRVAIGRAIVAEIGDEAAQRESERLHAEVVAMGRRR